MQSIAIALAGTSSFRKIPLTIRFSHIFLPFRSIRMKPDIDGLLRDVVPPIAAVYTSFLDFLISRKETESAAKVWTQLAVLHQPVERRHVFDYMRYLVSRQEVDQAQLVWEQAVNLS